MSIEARVKKEAAYGIIPMLKSDRTFGFWDILLVGAGYAIATWCYVHGGYVATLLPFKLAVSNILLGMTLAGLLVCFAVIIPARHGIDLWIYQRAMYGHKGVVVVWFIAMVCAYVGYMAINAKLYANAIMLIARSAGFPIGDQWNHWIAMTCVLFGWFLATKGPAAVRLSTRIMVPCLLCVGLLIMGLVFSKFSLSELSQIKPVHLDGDIDIWGNYMKVLEWNIAFIIGWFPFLGVIPRLAKSERAGYWGMLSGYCIIMAWFICIGAMTGLIMSSRTSAASVDPTEWLIQLGGLKLGCLSLVFIGFANITTQAISLYSVTVSSKVVKMEWNYKYIATFWALFIAAVVMWDAIWDYYPTIIALIGAVFGPALALLLTDFYVVRRQKFSMSGLFRLDEDEQYNFTKGFNLVTLGAFSVGVLSYFYVYNPITYAPNSRIFLFTTATGFAMITTAFVYLSLCRLNAVRRYMGCTEDDHQTTAVKQGGA